MISHNFHYPLRPRGTLELFDVSLKLYKKYFWPLLGVSTLVWMGIALIQVIFTMALFNVPVTTMVIVILVPAIFAIFLLPFLYSAVGSCLVAAIEAQDMSFRDCTRFAVKQYGRILSTILIAVLSAAFISLVYGLLLLLITEGPEKIVDVFPTLDNWVIYPFVAITVFVSLCLLFFVIFLIGFLCLFPLVACFEEEQNSFQLRKRCFVISWSRAKQLMNLVFLNGLGALVLLAILGGITGVGTSLILASDFMRGTTSDASSLLLIFAMITSFTFVGMIWSPFYLLTLGTFYYDVRIRKEAFDLEYQLTHPDRI